MGFKAIKMKVGLGVKQDFQNVKLMREIIGDDIVLMIDSNHAYSYNEALSHAKKVFVSPNQQYFRLVVQSSKHFQFINSVLFTPHKVHVSQFSSK